MNYSNPILKEYVVLSISLDLKLGIQAPSFYDGFLLSWSWTKARIHFPARKHLRKGFDFQGSGNNWLLYI